MANQNGTLILQALNEMEEPATIAKIVTHIAKTAGVHPNHVKESVKETLQGGLRYGYVQRSNRKYFAAPLEFDSPSEADAKDLGIPDNESGELMDKSRRRRKTGMDQRRRVSRRSGSRGSRRSKSSGSRRSSSGGSRRRRSRSHRSS